MKLIEWEVNEDDYQEQILIPEAQRRLALTQGITTENKEKVAVRIQNLNTGEIYTGQAFHHWEPSALPANGDSKDALRVK